MRERGLKRLEQTIVDFFQLSLPMRERGLKQNAPILGFKS